jgi:transcriptional regulator with XRE-family HTH domain
MFYVEHMSEAMNMAPGMVVPEWTIGDCMRKAREHAGLSQAELAHEISIGRTSVVRYETGLSTPSRPALLAWSFRTQVPYEWMCHGDTLPCGPDKRRSEDAEGTPGVSATKMQRLQTYECA